MPAIRVRDDTPHVTLLRANDQRDGRIRSRIDAPRRALDVTSAPHRRPRTRQARHDFHLVEARECTSGLHCICIRQRQRDGQRTRIQCPHCNRHGRAIRCAGDDVDTRRRGGRDARCKLHRDGYGGCVWRRHDLGCRGGANQCMRNATAGRERKLHVNHATGQSDITDGCLGIVSVGHEVAGSRQPCAHFQHVAAAQVHRSLHCIGRIQPDGDRAVLDAAPGH